MEYLTERTADTNEELLAVMTIVRNNNVILNAPTKPNGDEFRAERLLEVLKRELGSDVNLPPNSAVGAAQLWRKGNVTFDEFKVSVGQTDEEAAQLMKLARGAVENIYDEVYPDVAAYCKAWVAHAIEVASTRLPFSLEELAMVNPGAATPVEPSRLLSHLLDIHKRELLDKGEAKQRIGWFVDGHLAMSSLTVPYEKYRFFRSVSEVARRVHAEAILYVGDCYVRADGKRTGTEVLNATYVNPDGSCVAECLWYTRTHNSQAGKDSITCLPDQLNVEDNKLEQYLIPAWGEYHPH